MNKCSRCNKDYDLLTCGFPNLCKECFELFDAQKMEGRWNFVLLCVGVTKKEVIGIEDVAEWIKQNPYK